jgi:hypothetical protein
MYRDNPQGTTWVFDFDLQALGLPAPAIGGQFRVYVDQYQAAPTRGYYDHLYLNGVDIGYLTYDSATHWYTEGPFTGNNSVLTPTNNTLSVFAGKSTKPGENPTNYDDFEFTNVHMDYDATTIPAPAAILLTTIGIGLVGYLRRHRTF